MSNLGSRRTRRFFQDIKDIYDEDGFIVTSYAENCSWLKVQFCGVEGTEYEGGFFNIKMDLPSDFPFSAPKVYFLTDVFHPNVSATGKVCMSLLSEWKPATKLFHVAEACRALLQAGNPSSPLNEDAAHMMTVHPLLYSETSQYWTAVFANGPTRPQHLHQQVVEALQAGPSIRNEERALKILTRNMWNVEA